MFYFYDSQTFNIVNCPPPRILDKKKGGFFHLRKMACFPAITKNFMDADMMRSLSCFLQWVAYSSVPNDPTKVPILKQVQWIQDAMVKGKKGGGASVSFSLALDKRLEVTVKRALKDTEGVEFIHEYIVSLYGTNALRHLCPNFCYTFAIYQSPTKIVRMAMEKIPGLQIFEYLQQLNSADFSVQAMTDFLKIWVQIVLSLEVAQETLFFTHFDLHGQNVLVRPTDPPTPYLEYPIFDTIYRLENVSHLATVIDFGHSTVRYDKGFIGQNNNGFPQYGMYPFYVPGADLYKLLMYIWTVGYQPKFDSQKMGSRLGLFFQYCLEKFYQVQTVDPTKPNYISVQRVQTGFYNGTRLPSAFFSPYDMLQFFESRKQEVLGILGITAYPWTRSKITPVFTLYKTLRYRKKETYQCYQDLFCSTIEPMKRNLYSLTTRDANPGITQEEADIIFAKKVPLLEHAQLPQMRAFLEPAGLWARFNGYVEYKITESRKRGTVFQKDMTPFLYYYRAYVCILGYTSFVKV